MPSKAIKVHLFDVLSPSGRDLSDLLGRIHHTPKDSRWRTVGDHDMALVDSSAVKGAPLLMLDFVKKREVGPGKVKRSGKMLDFEFAEDEDFGEETGALWDAERRWLLVQYNHHGVRAPSIMSYLNLYEHEPDRDWVARPRLDPAAEMRMRRTELLRSATLKVQLNDKVKSVMREAGTALGEAITYTGDQAGAVTMEVTFSMSREGGYLDRTVMQFARRLRAKVGEDDGLVKLEVKGRTEENARDEVIDMLEEHLVGSFETRELEVQNRRYTLASRWRALRRVHAGFVAELG